MPLRLYLPTNASNNFTQSERTPAAFPEKSKDSNSSLQGFQWNVHKGKQMKKHRCQQGVDLFLKFKNVKKRPGQSNILVSTWPRRHSFDVEKIRSASVKSILGNRFFSFVFFSLDNFVSFVPGQKPRTA